MEQAKFKIGDLVITKDNYLNSLSGERTRGKIIEVKKLVSGFGYHLEGEKSSRTPWEYNTFYEHALELDTLTEEEIIKNIEEEIIKEISDKTITNYILKHTKSF